MRVFWAKGYDAVTIDDLVDGMGVGRPSLYAVFGDKAALFKRSLETYAEEQGAGAIKALQSPDGVRDSIAAFIVYAVKTRRRRVRPGDVFWVRAPVVDDPDVRDFLVRADGRPCSSSSSDSAARSTRGSWLPIFPSLYGLAR